MNATPSFNSAKTYLNRFHLNDLLVISAVLSSLNNFLNIDSSIDNEIYENLKSYTNSSFTDFLSKAIIYSKSSNFKNKQFKGKDFQKIYNLYLTSGNEELPDDFVKNKFGSDGVPFFNVYLSNQVRLYRSSSAEQIGLYYQLLVEIPAKKGLQIQRKRPDVYIDINQEIYSLTGLTIKDYLVVSLIIEALQLEQFLSLLVNDICVAFMNAVYKNRFIYDVIEIVVKNKNRMFLNIQDLYWNGLVSQDKVDRFLRLMSCSKKELSQKIPMPKFSQGFVSSSLNPFYDTSIIRENDSLIVPNMFIYSSSIGNSLIHKISNEFKIKRLFESMGYLQEAYIEKIVRDCLSDLFVITEKKYKRDGTKFEGIDLTIIENDKIICIESKRKPIRLESKVGYSPETVISDLKPTLVDVFAKLKEKKVPDLINRPDVYPEIPESIHNSLCNNAIFVCVLSDTVMGIQELFYHFIYDENYTNKCCVMDLITFSKAVDIAESNNISLYGLLEQYYNEATKVGISGHVSDSFGWISHSNDISYLTMSYEILFHELFRSAQSENINI